MTSRLTDIILDCSDLERMAKFWCAVLGYERANSGDGWLSIAQGSNMSAADPSSSAQPPALAFVLVTEQKTTKNRTHVDVTPIGTTQDDEVARLVGLGAVRIDIGQGGEAWVVMADPEGNEFCVMPEVGSL